MSQQRDQPGGVGGEAGTGGTGGVQVSLSQMRVGELGVIAEKRLEEDDRALLRAMGLACNATVKVCRAGEPCIVAVMSGCSAGGRVGGDSCRIGLARPLAERIVVRLLSGERRGAGAGGEG
ncbi:MAG: ferrous iron transport protein A, partial [Phycisphaerae bacterium]|nr:ferrous iron transport protein A [Phycisphaerae bacterium]